MSLMPGPKRMCKISRVTKPERPNNKIVESAIANGGEIVGKSVSACTKPLNGMSQRTTVYANKKPSSVLPSAASTPISIVHARTSQYARA